MTPDETIERLRRADPIATCRSLGFTSLIVRNRAAVMVRCPAHAERTPSCSVFRARSGRLRVHCFSCSFSGDVFDLVACVQGLGGAGFPVLIERTTQLLGTPPAAPSPGPISRGPRTYPPQRVVRALWANARSIPTDDSAAAMMAQRGLVSVDPALARVIAPFAALPAFAGTRRGSWAETGHRLIVRMFDAQGRLRSLRAWDVTARRGGPKRLPPRGYSADRLMMLNRQGWEVLCQRARPRDLVIVEGEPDFLTASAAYSCAVWGLVAGSWCPAFAGAIPGGSRVLVATHPDSAGDRYAREIQRSVGERVELLRFR